MRDLILVAMVKSAKELFEEISASRLRKMVTFGNQSEQVHFPFFHHDRIHFLSDLFSGLISRNRRVFVDLQYIYKVLMAILDFTDVFGLSVENFLWLENFYDDLGLVFSEAD